MTNTAEWNPDQHGSVATEIRETSDPDHQLSVRQVLVGIALFVAIMAGSFVAYQAMVPDMDDYEFFEEVDPATLPPLYFQGQVNPPEVKPEHSGIPERDPSALH